VVTPIANDLLRKFDAPRPVRLLGVKVAGLDEDRAAGDDATAEHPAQLALPL
jgi:hypothetical protein